MNLTLAELYQTIKQQLLPVVGASAQATAEADLIMQHLLNVTSSQVFSMGERELTESEKLKVASFMDQRVSKRIPIQYLFHEAWFYGRRFYVNPHVLIPRPETELLVEQVLAHLKPGMSVLDIGVGSGAIAITLSLELGDAVRVVGVDISKSALKVAQINQRTLGSTVDFKPAGDLFQPLSGNASGNNSKNSTEQFDVIVSNPPYIDRALKASLSPEVVWHEPEEALFPPSDDPCYYYRQIAQEAKHFLKPSGWLMVETGAGMSPDVTQIFMAAGFSQVKTIRDYAQMDRMVLAQLN